MKAFSLKAPWWITFSMAPKIFGGDVSIGNIKQKASCNRILWPVAFSLALFVQYTEDIATTLLVKYFCSVRLSFGGVPFWTFILVVVCCPPLSQKFPQALQGLKHFFPLSARSSLCWPHNRWANVHGLLHNCTSNSHNRQLLWLHLHTSVFMVRPFIHLSGSGHNHNAKFPGA